MLTLKQATMLGDIPGDWQVKPLKSLLSGNFPGDWGEDKGPHMVGVLRSTNLTNDGRLDISDIAYRALNPKEVAALAPQAGDILLERSGGGPQQPVGRVGFIESDMPNHAFSNFLHLLRPNRDSINPRFLGWVLYRINRTGRVLRLEQQTTQIRNLHFRDYLTMPLPIPPPDEQAAIARILDAVDTAIERTREAVEQAAEVKRALTQEVFTDGLRGKRLKKTSIGWIPESWEVKPLGTVVREFQYGLSLPMHNKGNTPILRMGNIQSGNVFLTDLKYVSLEKSLLEKYVLSRGDVLFNRTNSQEHVGKVGIYRSEQQAVFASYLIRLHPDEEQIDRYFLGQLLNSYGAQCRIKRYATPGVQQVNINAKNLSRVLIPVPMGKSGLEEQRDIADILEKADDHVQCYEPIVMAQQQLKKSLMHDLLTGAVRVDPAVLASLPEPP